MWKLLYKAIEQLEVHGWTRNKLQDHTGAFCILGAIMRAAGMTNINNINGRGTIPKRVRMAQLLLGQYLSAKGCASPDIPFFNDSCCRSKEQAVDFLLNAAEWIQNRKSPERLAAAMIQRAAAGPDPAVIVTNATSYSIDGNMITVTFDFDSLDFAFAGIAEKIAKVTADHIQTAMLIKEGMHCGIVPKPPTKLVDWSGPGIYSTTILAPPVKNDWFFEPQTA